MQKFFLSCDWGTTAFRLRLVNAGNLTVIAEVVSTEGISGTYDRWKARHGTDHCSREEFYLNMLYRQVQVLEEQVQTPLKDTVLVVSGMASSSIGIRELPYAPLPFSLDGSDAVVQTIPAGPMSGKKVVLISGARAESDVMRGEETQLVGLTSLFRADQEEEVTCIFPGTHSKHITISKGKLVNIRTYITGEVFGLMAGHSILKEGVSAGARPMDEEDIAAFNNGIDRSGETNLLHALFTVRLNYLFKTLDKERNYYFLSGLLIGAELTDLRGKPDLRLCSGSNLFELYRLGMERSGLVSNTTFIAPALMDMAVIRGQWNIFRKFSDQ